MSMSPYAAHKVVNAALAAAGLDKVVPPQMMYNYTTGRINKGKAPLIACDENNLVTEAGLEEWLAKYLVKQGVKLAAPPVTPASIDWDGNPVVTEELVTEEA